MAALVKYQDYIEKLHTAIHSWPAAGHTFRSAIHTDAPTVATDDELADLTQVTGTGYTAGGSDIQNDGTETTGTFTATAVDVTETAGASDWIAARYIAIHNDTSTGKKLCFDYDYGSNFTLLIGETMTLDFGASVFTAA
jgi:hypothetical protein